ncbi:P2Y purinoceptor 8-like [Python bivittatus]|uniref:P2Y purinoceptor 8-like n=1 Tax=Python bivittatus TaxID=176946 RepID=A0A9F5MZB9_PYTBI|nr:P2Y purinoceptor 8-like [Python bivittatus]
MVSFKFLTELLTNQLIVEEETQCLCCSEGLFHQPVFLLLKSRTEPLLIFRRRIVQDIFVAITSKSLLEMPLVNSPRNVTNITLAALQSDAIQRILPALFMLNCSISIPLNLISLLFLCWYSRPWTSTIIFCINLTISDLLYGFILPFQIAYHLKKNNWPFGDVLCHVVTILSYGNLHCSILTMMSLSIERYVGIVHPLRYKAGRTIRASFLVCISTWALVLLTLFPLMQHKLTVRIQQLPITTCFDVLPKEMFNTRTEFIAYFGSLLFLFFFLPLIIMGFCYISIILTLRHSSSSQFRETKRQTIYFIIVLLLLITVCYLPHIVMSVTHYILVFQKKSFYVEYKLSLATASFHCCFNPFLYYFGSKEFRQKIQRKLCRCVAVGVSENSHIVSEHDMQIMPVQQAPKI